MRRSAAPPRASAPPRRCRWFCLAFILVWGLRSVWLATTAFLAIVVGLIWTAFFAVAVFEDLNLISVAFAVLFVGLAEDFVIHFGLRVREGIDSGAQHLKALGDSAEGAGSALLFLAAATATGFLAFVPTEYVGLAELGMIASMGMVIALVVTLTLMPALLSLRPLPQRPRRILDAAVTAESGSAAPCRTHRRARRRCRRRWRPCPWAGCNSIPIHSISRIPAPSP